VELLAVKSGVDPRIEGLEGAEVVDYEAKRRPAFEL
jgi:hypothetical protein